MLMKTDFQLDRTHVNQESNFLSFLIKNFQVLIYLEVFYLLFMLI